MYIYIVRTFILWYTMANRINIDDLKAEYIGKQINWFIIINIYRNDKNIIMFTCKCKCGKEVNITKKRLFANPPISCGCFKSSPEGRALKKQYYIDHPEARQNLSDARKKYNSEHPDEVKEIHLRIKQLYEQDPQRRDIVSKRISNWFKDNPEKVRELSEKHSQWFKDNPEKVKLGVEKQKESYNKTIEQTKDKIKQWFKDNPDFYKDWMTNNPDKVINMRNAYKKTMKEKRLQKDSSTLMQVIHPSQIELLINGDLTAQSIIKTKCPICNNYAEHIMHNVYNLTTNEFLYNSPPLCNNCRNNLSSSHIETDIYNYIATFYNGECIKNSRNIISPYELDLYYPEKKIAIEFNGLYWHSEQAGKSKEYHFNKFKLCREKGIRLISIFEQDWLYKNQKIKNILSNIFNRKIKIYARNCIIKLLDFRTKSDFINTYHFDGDSIQGNISYGLYYNNELVSVMSFGKLRGQNSLRHNNDYYTIAVIYAPVSC